MLKRDRDNAVRMELLGSDGKIYKAPIKDGMVCVPDEWAGEVKQAYFDYIYPNGYCIMRKIKDV